jgi:hypothetical protein
VTFLVLTFPFQIVWLADQIYKLQLHENEQRSLSASLNSTTSANHNGTEINVFQVILYAVQDVTLIIRNLNFSINFFLYSTMSNLFRKELNVVFQNIGFYDFSLFKNSISSSAAAAVANGDAPAATTIMLCSSPNRSRAGSVGVAAGGQLRKSRLNSGKGVPEAKPSNHACTEL